VLASTLVCDNYGGYKASFQQGITEIGCAAHARRKLYALHANHSSEVAKQALPFFAALYDVERDISFDSIGRSPAATRFTNG
jgi:hypothetical protein